MHQHNTVIFCLVLCFLTYLQAQMVQQLPDQVLITYDLCVDPMIMLTSREARGQNASVVYRLSTQNCGNKEIQLYHFLNKELSTYHSLRIFEGELDTGTLLAYEFYDTNNRENCVLTIQSGLVNVQIVRRIGQETAALYEMYGLATTMYNDHCGEVRPVSSVHSDSTIPTNSADCVDIYFSFSPQYYRTWTNHVYIDKIVPISMFKGVSTNADHSVTGVKGQLPELVYGPFLTVRTPKNTKEYRISIVPFIELDVDQQIDVSTENPSGVIVSMDYVEVPSEETTRQTFTLYHNKLGEHSIRLSVIKPLFDDDIVDIEEHLLNNVISRKRYTQKNGKFQLDAQATKLILTYTSNRVRSPSGFCAAYERGEPYGSAAGGGGRGNGSFLLVLVLILLPIVMVRK